MRGWNDTLPDQVTYQRPSCIFNQPATEHKAKAPAAMGFLGLGLDLCQKIVLNVMNICLKEARSGWDC